MKYLILLSALLIFSCSNSVKNESEKQAENEKVISEQPTDNSVDSEKVIEGSAQVKIEYTEKELFEMFCDSISNIILPINTNCHDNIIPNDKGQSYNGITNPKYVGDSWAVDGKIVKENYVLIIHHYDTDGTLVFLRTLDKNGKKIDEIKLYHADCVPTIEDTFDVGYAIFEENMRITQIDSTLWYRTDENGNQIQGLEPIGKEHYRVVYQLSDSGEFIKTK
ncbi:hypothetical protein ACFLS4_04980 [Bacteroidota bacterium]